MDLAVRAAISLLGVYLAASSPASGETSGKGAIENADDGVVVGGPVLDSPEHVGTEGETLDIEGSSTGVTTPVVAARARSDSRHAVLSE